MSGTSYCATTDAIQASSSPRSESFIEIWGRDALHPNNVRRADFLERKERWLPAKDEIVAFQVRGADSRRAGRKRRGLLCGPFNRLRVNLIGRTGAGVLAAASLQATDGPHGHIVIAQKLAAKPHSLKTARL